MDAHKVGSSRSFSQKEQESQKRMAQLQDRLKHCCGAARWP